MITRFGDLITCEERVRDLIDFLERLAPTDCTLLLIGESGTGKEVVCNAVHDHSRRRNGPLVAVSCAAIPETLFESELFGHTKGAFTGAIRDYAGKLEQANGGTLFLDEIGEMPLAVQVKLLRVIETRKFERVGSGKPVSLNARLICATHRDLELEIKERRFRLDLYHRINEFRVDLPPLRERPGDLHLLAALFLEQFSRELEKSVRYISLAALGVLQQLTYEGNIRQLRNVLKQAVFNCQDDTIWVEHLPIALRVVNGASDHDPPRIKISEAGGEAVASGEILPLDEVERLHILRAMRKFGGNKSQVAQALKIQRCTLYNKLRKYGLQGD